MIEWEPQDLDLDQNQDPQDLAHSLPGVEAGVEVEVEVEAIQGQEAEVIEVEADQEGPTAVQGADQDPFHPGVGVEVEVQRFLEVEVEAWVDQLEA